MSNDENSPGQSAPGAADPHRPTDGQRPFDALPHNPLRGPLIFGVVAATLELAVLLLIVSC